MAEHHKSELVGRVDRVVVGVLRLEVVTDRRGRCGVEPSDFVVVYGLVLVVLFTGDAGGDVLVCEAEYGVPV